MKILSERGVYPTRIKRAKDLVVERAEGRQRQPSRMWRKRNPHALLVGMQTGAATVENNMEIPQKVENEITL